MIFDRGETIPSSIDVKNPAGALYDPDTSILITITAPSGVDVVTAQAMTKDSTGIYHYNWLSPSDAETGTYTRKYVTVDTLAGTSIQYGSFVLAARSPSTGKSIGALIDEVSVVLEDTGNAIFSDAVIAQELGYAAIRVSMSSLCESQETVLLTARSTDVDVTGIEGLRKILKAEYPTGKCPKEFHNVTHFSNIATIETDATPAAGEQAVLYCLKLHILDTSASTLTPELEPIVVNLAAGNVALNNIGDGRTQIKAAIDAAALANSAVDSMATRIGQATTDIVSARNAISTDLSSAGTAITAVGNTITTAMASIASGKSAASAIAADVTAAGTQLGLAITDVGAARTKLATAIAAFSSQLSDISAQIGDSEDDLAAARALNNTIPTWATAETGLHSSASGGFGAASSRINEIRTILNESTGITQEGTLASNQLNIVSGLLNELRVTLSANEGKAGQYRGLGSAELVAANTYIGQAGALLSKISQTVNIYIETAAHELTTAGGYLNEASGYMREGASRQSISNTQLNFTAWGRNKVQQAEAELQRLVKPHEYLPYSRS